MRTRRARIPVECGQRVIDIEAKHRVDEGIVEVYVQRRLIVTLDHVPGVKLATQVREWIARNDADEVATYGYSVHDWLIDLSLLLEAA